MLLCGCGDTPHLNVLLVTFDTTRADHIGCYGNDSVSTPTIDGIAAQGVLFRNAYSPIPITLPSHTTMLTGMTPLSHGVRDNGLFVVPAEVETLAEVLSRAGYACAAAIGSYPLMAKFGLDQGFELYDDRVAARWEDHRGRQVRFKQDLYFDERKAARVNDALVPWLTENSSRPFFAWAHYYDPHHPLDPPPPYDQLYANRPYDGEIAYADESFGTLLEELRRLGVEDRTVVVFASDHGEGLGEHNETTHSMLLYDTTLRVPLVFRVPGGVEGRTVEERVGLIDITPTILDLLGIEPPRNLDGRSLAPLLLSPAPPAATSSRDLYIETLSPRLVNGWGELRGILSYDYKYIHGPRPELFNLTTDPHELTNLYADEPDRAAGLRSRLEQQLDALDGAGRSAAAELDEESRRRLAALGYLLPSGTDADTITEELVEGGIAPQDRVGDVNDISAAKSLLFRRRPLEARELLLALVDRDPENALYRELLMTAQLQLGMVDEALTSLEVLRGPTGEDDVTESLLHNLVAVLFAQEQRQQSIQLLEDHLDRKDSANGRYLLATLRGRIGDVEGQHAALRHALNVDPEHVPARVDLAVHLSETGSEEAEAEFLRAIASGRYSSRAHFNYGAYLVKNGQLARAADFFERAAELNPRYLQAHLARVSVALDLGDPEAAARAYDQLRQVEPASDEARLAADLLAGDA
jgi:arylsulfatase A-like enzyme/Tfp pilus assembly protein PilF